MLLSGSSCSKGICNLFLSIPIYKQEIVSYHASHLSERASSPFLSRSRRTLFSPSTRPQLPCALEGMAAPPATQLPLADTLLNCLDDFQAHSNELFAALSSQNAPATRQVLADLQDTDERMAALLRVLPQHQTNQANIVSLVDRIRTYDATYRKEVAEAYHKRDELVALIRSGRKAQPSTTAHIPSSQLLSLARQLAPFTSAPILSDADKQAGGPIPPHERALRAPGAYPPFPPEEEIRRGVLGFVSAQAGGAEAQQGETGQMPGGAAGAQEEQGTAAAAHNQERMRMMGLAGEGSFMDQHRWDGGFGAMDPAKRKELEEKERADMESAFDLDLNPDLDDD